MKVSYNFFSISNWLDELCLNVNGLFNKETYFSRHLLNLKFLSGCQISLVEPVKRSEYITCKATCFSDGGGLNMKIKA